MKIILIEDSPEDALLIERALAGGGIPAELVRVETEEDFRAEVDQGPPELILSDHGLPAFDGFQALALAHRLCPEVPFIFVTGAMGEQTAIRTFEAGATDYVLKANLESDLLPAVDRARRRVEDQRRQREEAAARERILQEVRQALQQLRELSRLIPICASCKKIRDEEGAWHPIEKYLHDHLELLFTHGICPGCAEAFFRELRESR